MAVRRSPLTLLFLGACTSATNATEPSRHIHSASVTTSPPDAAVVASAYCAAIKGLTEDAAGDLTGRANDEARVQGVMASHLDEVRTCPGVSGMDMSIAAFADSELGERADFPDVRPGDVGANFVLRLFVRERRYVPAKNPLYLDGVRVYVFTRSFEPL